MRWASIWSTLPTCPASDPTTSICSRIWDASATVDLLKWEGAAECSATPCGSTMPAPVRSGRGALLRERAAALLWGGEGLVARDGGELLVIVPGRLRLGRCL